MFVWFSVVYTDMAAVHGVHGPERRIAEVHVGNFHICAVHELDQMASGDFFFATVVHSPPWRAVAVDCAPCILARCYLWSQAVKNVKELNSNYLNWCWEGLIVEESNIVKAKRTQTKPILTQTDAYRYIDQMFSVNEGGTAWTYFVFEWTGTVILLMILSLSWRVREHCQTSMVSPLTITRHRGNHWPQWKVWRRPQLLFSWTSNFSVST